MRNSIFLATRRTAIAVRYLSPRRDIADSMCDPKRAMFLHDRIGRRGFRIAARIRICTRQVIRWPVAVRQPKHSNQLTEGDYMKKSWLVIALLFLSLAALTERAIGTVKAGLYCDQLRGCFGQAGCLNFGSANGCSITCSDGTSVNCGIIIIICDPCDGGPDPVDQQPI